MTTEEEHVHNLNPRVVHSRDASYEVMECNCGFWQTNFVALPAARVSYVPVDPPKKKRGTNTS